MKRIFNLNTKTSHSVKLIGLATLYSLSFSAKASSVGLMEVYQSAQQHDAVLAQSQATYEANQQLVKTAKAPLMPQVSLNGSLGINESSNDAADVTTRDVSLQVKQALYQKDVFARFNQAEYLFDQAEITLKVAEQDLIIRVAQAYFKVLLAEEDLRIANAKEESDKTSLDLARASAEAGLSDKTDSLQAKSSLDLSRSERISAENNLDVAKEQLMKLTGRMYEDLKGVALHTAFKPLSRSLADWEKQAQSQNLTVQQLESQTLVAQEEVQVQKAGNWVNASLTASYSDKAYSGFSSTYSGSYQDRNDLYVGVNLSMPLYSGGAVPAKVSEARSKLKSANEALRNAREQAKLEARIQTRNIERGLALVEALREAVKSNDAFLEAAEERYRVGLKSMLDVLSARTNKYKARRDLKSAMHNVILAKLQLKLAVGSLDDSALKAVNQLLIQTKK